MRKSLMGPLALVVTAALFSAIPAALAQTSPSQSAATIGALKCSDLTGLSEDESHDLILYIAGYQVGMSQAPGAAGGAAASTAAPAATDATGAATSTTPADTAMAPATTSTTAAPSSSSKLAQLVGLGIEPQAIVTACGPTPDSAVLDVITSNATTTTTP